MSHIVKGPTVDFETRCIHYNSEKDIIAIKFYCCGDYYPCYQCHEEAADHPVQAWPREKFNRQAVLCGVCNTQLTIQEYLTCNSVCPTCQAQMNPGCALHSHIYFDI